LHEWLRISKSLKKLVNDYKITDKAAITRLGAEQIENAKRDATKDVELKLLKTQQQADAAQQQANAAQQQADAAQQQANAANTMLMNLIRNFKGSVEEIAKITQLSEDEIRAIRQMKD
jgi:Zn-dependent M16 (insulinase) family peptidase